MLYVLFVGFTHRNSIIQYYYLYNIIIYYAHNRPAVQQLSVKRDEWHVYSSIIIIYGSSGSPKYFLGL